MTHHDDSLGHSGLTGVVGDVVKAAHKAELVCLAEGGNKQTLSYQEKH